jgi:hypothetical protein
VKDTEAEEKAAQQNLHIWLSDMFTADDQSVRIFDVDRYKQSGKTTQQQAYLADIAYRFAGKTLLARTGTISKTRWIL